MADGLPTGDLVIFGFCELLAIGFACDFAVKLLNGDFVLASIAFVITLTLFIAGIKWPTIKTRISVPVVAKIERIASSPRARIAVLLLIIGGFVFQSVFYMHTLRSDLDTYVMPRIVTEKQSRDMRKILSQHEPHPVAVKVNPLDQEALDYAENLSTVLSLANWNPTLDTSNTRPTAGNNRVCVATTGTGTNSYDAKHDPARIVEEALVAANIEACGSGGGNGEYKLYLVVGHRPMKLGDQAPIWVRLGGWLQGLGN